MKTATVRELRKELQEKNFIELVEVCVRLSKHKKENKELLTYLLFEAADEEGFIDSVKREVDEAFEEINSTSSYIRKKNLRKILRRIKTYIRYSKQAETEIELLLYFCQKMKNLRPSINRSFALKKIFEQQVAMIERKLEKLHEDLQYDFGVELEKLKQ